MLKICKLSINKVESSKMLIRKKGYTSPNKILLLESTIIYLE